MFHRIIWALKNREIPSLTDSLRWGSHCWPRLFYWNFIYGILTAVWGMALIVPGVLVFIRYSLLSVVIIFEHEKEKNPLGRSKSLVKNHFMALFGATSILLIIPSLAFGCGELLIKYKLNLTDHWILLSGYDVLNDIALFPYSLMTLLAYFAWTSKRGSR